MAHIRIENSYLRTKEFLTFTGTSEHRVLLFLIAQIVRKIKKNTPAGAVKIYNNYYKNKMLCASYSMENIAKYFGWGSEDKPNKSNVSKIIKNLNEMGLLKIHKENTPLGKKYVYELGYYEVSGDGSIKETLYFDEYFSKFVKNEEKPDLEANKKKGKNQYYQYYDKVNIEKKRYDYRTEEPNMYEIEKSNQYQLDAYIEEFGEDSLLLDCMKD